MKIKHKGYFALSVLCLLLALFLLYTAIRPVFGDDQLPQQSTPPMAFLIADGSSSGTYKQMLKEMQQQDNIASVVAFKEVDSSGAVQNLELLTTNKVSCAFMHSDVLYFNAQTRDLSQFKTVLALYKEDVHFIALATSKKVSGGSWYKAGVPIQINSIDDLNGLTVGAAGGGYITSNVIKSLCQLGYTVRQYNSGAELMAALDRGEVDAAEFTGGAPLPNFANFGPQYKLLPIPDRDIALLKGQYVPSTISYTNISPTPVNTVAARCLLVGRVYTLPKYVKMLHDFRAAFFSDLDSLKQTPGLHPKWQEVDATNHGPWAWMHLGDDNTIPKAADLPPPDGQ